MSAHQGKPSADWKSFALLLIDVQEGYWWGTESYPAFPDFSKNVEKLLAFCREQQIDVVHLHLRFKEDKSDWPPFELLGAGITCIEGTPSVASTAFARERKDEKVFYKQSLDGFVHPDLKKYLIQNEKRFLFAAGLITSVCVLLTAASATQHGFLTAIIEDCCADQQKAAHDFALGHFEGFSFYRTQLSQLSSSREKWLNDVKMLPVPK
jgi:nicotinamidase-related amidase